MPRPATRLPPASAPCAPAPRAGETTQYHRGRGAARSAQGARSAAALRPHAYTHLTRAGGTNSLPEAPRLILLVFQSKFPIQ
jgi:hypothetical protein